MDFADLLSPLGISEFLQSFWEREPLLIAREAPEFYGSIFSLADIDRLLVQSRPAYPQIRMVSKASGMAWDALSEGWLKGEGHGSLRAVHEAYANGNSLIVELRRLWPEIDRLCRSAEVLLNHRASAEMYLTPPGSQAFDIHYDLHDVFLLQLEGSKEWRIYDPVFPFPTAEADPNPLCGELVGEPRQKLRLEKGDLLYMPRGFPHQGLTSAEASLHVTIGVFPYRWHDLAVRALALASGEHEILRRSLPVGFLQPATREGLRAHLKSCLAVLQDETLAERALDKLSEEFLAGLTPVPNGQFEQINRLPEMNSATCLERRENMLCLVRSGSDSVTLHYPGGSISGPSWLRNAFERVAASARSFRVSELADGVDDESKLVLARRLVREGVLRIVGTVP